MKKILLLACTAAVALSTAACARNAASTLPPMSAAPQAQSAFGGLTAGSTVKDGWASTFTQSIPIASARDANASSLLADSVPLRIVVGLSMRNRVGAERAVRNRVILTPSQFTAEFNPTESQAEDVASYLRRQGLTNVTIEPNHLIVSATGSASKVEGAFHTTIRTTRSNGQLVYANVTPAMVPVKFKGLVIAVLGLNNVYAMHTHLLRTTRTFAPMAPAGMHPNAVGTPPPCLQVVNGICVGGEYGPLEYQTAYDANATQCPRICTGANMSIAVMAEGNVSGVVTDLRKAEAFWGTDKVPYTVKKVGIASTDTSGMDEWDLDTQISSGMAAIVKELYVYDTTSLGDSDTSLEFSHWVTDDLAKAGNASFGEAEDVAFADGAMQLDDEEFNEAAAQGQTLFASTGDNGEGCPVVAATGVPNTGLPTVCYPAASPYVVAVGGTTLDTNAVGSGPGTYYGEHVWVGTGGGYSKYENAPYWQTNGICAVCAANALRGIADISMCADNNGCPMDVFVNGAQTGVGGTSLASPMSMGVWARFDSHFGEKLGFAAPVYYGVYAKYEPCPLGSTACTPAGEPGDATAALPPDTTAPVGGFHDILIGSNGVPSSALPGWDTPTGLGTIDVAVMLKDIANSEFSGH